MHAFNQGADKDLRTQLANRLAGTAFGELLGQRFEQVRSLMAALRLSSLIHC